jgi:hypothetical protein
MVIWTEQTYTSTTPSHPAKKNKKNQTNKDQKTNRKKKKKYNYVNNLCAFFTLRERFNSHFTRKIAVVSIS